MGRTFSRGTTGPYDGTIRRGQRDGTARGWIGCNIELPREGAKGRSWGRSWHGAGGGKELERSWQGGETGKGASYLLARTGDK